jgi:CheR methyltransferase, SAM binding domain
MRHRRGALLARDDAAAAGRLRSRSYLDSRTRPEPGIRHEGAPRSLFGLGYARDTARLCQTIFRRERSHFVLDDRVRAMVRFEERNLALEDRDFWQPCSFDIIFCRNVVMYVSARALGEVIARVCACPRP